MSSDTSTENLSGEKSKKDKDHTIKNFDDLIIDFSNIKNKIEGHGHQMQNITINGSIMWTVNDEILELIQRCCKPNQLRLLCFQINKSTVPILAQVLQFVQKVEMFYCPINFGNTRQGYDQLFKNCDHLKELSIIHPNATLESKLLAMTFPNLTKLHLIIDELSDANLMVTFIRNHPKLERFVYLPQILPTNKTIPWINKLKTLPNNLEEFGVTMTVADVDQHLDLLSELNNLKRIHIECNYMNEYNMDFVLDELTKYKSLEVLSICKVKFQIEFSNALAKMTNLKTLELRQFSNTYKINQIITSKMTKQMNLENLYLDETIVKNADDFSILLDNNFKNLQNLYLCDVKNIFLLHDAKELGVWHNKIGPIIKIYIDDHCIWNLHQKDDNCSIDDGNVKFVPFENRMSQKFNVLIET